MNFVGSLRALSSDVSTQLSEKDISPTAQIHLLYTRFRTVSTKVAPLFGELERHALAYPDELSALLSECHSAYFYARKQLLVPRILEEIKGLDPANESCTAENQLYQYLETLCDFLYDDLRPRILHEPRITALFCDDCTVHQALMVSDAPPSSFSTVFSANSDNDESGDDDADQSEDDEDDAADRLTTDIDNPHPKGKGKDGFFVAFIQLYLLCAYLIGYCGRYFDPEKHRQIVAENSYTSNHPLVDIYLLCCKERLEVLENTYNRLNPSDIARSKYGWSRALARHRSSSIALYKPMEIVSELQSALAVMPSTVVKHWSNLEGQPTLDTEDVHTGFYAVTRVGCSSIFPSLPLVASRGTLLQLASRSKCVGAPAPLHPSPTAISGSQTPALSRRSAT
ncbi:hypothetical protein K443DRAFT_11625 [Laccaria amethystina LaAM-08-1]|uniref:Conserved oligomeric Golgi complex subunit 3 C-terminal domain-containing protein n=1 Tax=Laccaria amethystina LaAM-08-1 TaxID=1095629 RepID=A0A0C9X1F5_9AGAR|nr:hypothetical protein K443DRAFT_11625 [Laccaria amethystina LaAM-08-1]